MADIRIPSSIEEAAERLVALDQLVTAEEWERAAIVYAFTYEGGNQHDRASRDSVRHPVIGFARLGIKGLSSQDTVRRYRRAWQKAIDVYGCAEPTPGALIQLPDVEWAKAEVTDQRRFVEKTPKSIARLVQTDPVIRAAAFDAAIDADPGLVEPQPLDPEVLADDPEVQRAVHRRTAERIAALPKLEPLEKPEPNENLDDMGLTVALGNFERAAVAVADAIRRPIVDREMRDTVAATFANVRNIMDGAEQLAAGFDPEDLLR